MQQSVPNYKHNRVVPIILKNASSTALQLDKVCKFANECQESFVFGTFSEADGLPIEVVDEIGDLELFHMTAERGLINVKYLKGACQLARLGAREYVAILAMFAGLNVLALRESADLIAEDLQPAHHPPCILSPAQSELELFSNLDQLTLCARCADFLCALGLEGHVLATQQVLRTVYERRRDRSHFRWGLKGMERPPTRPL